MAERLSNTGDIPASILGFLAGACTLTFCKNAESAPVNMLLRSQSQMRTGIKTGVQGVDIDARAGFVLNMKQ